MRHVPVANYGTLKESIYWREPFVLKWPSPSFPGYVTPFEFQWMPRNIGNSMLIWNYPPGFPSYTTTVTATSSLSIERDAGRYHLGAEWLYQKIGSGTYVRKVRLFWGLEGSFTYSSYYNLPIGGSTTAYSLRINLKPSGVPPVYEDRFTVLEWASLSVSFTFSGALLEKVFATGLDLGDGDAACDWRWSTVFSSYKDPWPDDNLQAIFWGTTLDGEQVSFRGL